MQRIFYIFDTKGDIVRGCHANRESQFFMFCIKGSCRVRVDNGKTKSEAALIIKGQMMRLQSFTMEILLNLVDTKMSIMT